MRSIRARVVGAALGALVMLGVGHVYSRLGGT